MQGTLIPYNSHDPSPNYNFNSEGNTAPKNQGIPFFNNNFNIY